MADTKVSALTAIDALVAADLIPVVDDPAGTPVSKKATMAQVQDFIEGSANVFTTAQTFQPATDVAAVTARRSASDATADILMIQAQDNAVLTAFDKDGKLKFNGSTSGTVTIQPAAAAGTYTLTLPTSDGDNGQVLQTNGSGVLSWATPSGGGSQIVQLLVLDDDTTLNVGDGAGSLFFRVPSALNGLNLTGVAAAVAVAGTTGTTDIQIHNVTQAADMLSTKITIDSTETDSKDAAAAAVIDTGNDDVATGDILRIDIDAVSTTKPKGLVVELVFGS
jgi:hypothetical protein